MPECPSCGVQKTAETCAKGLRAGFQVYCKKCMRVKYTETKRRSSIAWLKANPEKRQEYERSVEAWPSLVMRHLKGSSKRRGHPAPEITRAELIEMTKTELFQELFSAWRSSGFDRMMVVGLDRLDNHKHYTMDNVRLCTWRENNQAWVATRIMKDRRWVT